MNDDTDRIEVSFSCERCGSQLLWKDDLRDDEPVTCPDCGHKGPTLGELKATTFEAAKEHVEKVVGQPIKWEPE
jgi:DNA-directed RNA polymerase subunit RPC12/RpoP